MEPVFKTEYSLKIYKLKLFSWFVIQYGHIDEEEEEEKTEMGLVIRKNVKRESENLNPNILDVQW
jgi:hypothetical protein